MAASVTCIRVTVVKQPMGCLCSKDTAIEDSWGSPRERGPVSNGRNTISSSRRGVTVQDKGAAADHGDKSGHAVTWEKRVQRSVRVDSSGRKREKLADALLQHFATGAIPRVTEAEQVAAGWPAWLAAAAGEAIRGWVPRRADSFEKLGKIGQGTYSNVYRARDLENGKIVALKKVRFDNLEPESVRFMAREIHILRRLDHPNIVKLEGLVTSRMSCSLYLVFECMEHDLAGLASCPGLKFTEPQVKCYMQQLLCGLDHCHCRNILHRDIKGSNLLIDNCGVLKIADFGLASFFDPYRGHPLTSRVVTLWYRPPELLLGATDYGIAVDLWSVGCILAELYAGKPIMPGRTEVEQLHKIFKLCGSPSDEYWRKSKLPHATVFKPPQPYKRCVLQTFKNFPASALSLIDILLSIDPIDRGTAASALKSEYFTTNPFPSDPSSLPKYPPSKEFDAKMRDEETRRDMDGVTVHWLDPEKKGSREAKAVPAPDANAELTVSLQKRYGQPSSRSQSEKFHSQQDESASSFSIDPPRLDASLPREARETSQGHTCNRASYSGPLSHSRRARMHDVGASRVASGTDHPPASGLVAAKCNSSKKFRLPQSEVSGLPKSGIKGVNDVGKNVVAHEIGDTQASGNQSVFGYGSMRSKIQYSGPLVRSSGNMDQVLKEHDHQIQEAVCRAWRDRVRIRKLQAEGDHFSLKPYRGDSVFLSGQR